LKKVSRRTVSFLVDTGPPYRLRWLKHSEYFVILAERDGQTDGRTDGRLGDSYDVRPAKHSAVIHNAQYPDH